MEEPLPTYTDSPRLPQAIDAAVSLDGKSLGIASSLARFEYEAEKTSIQDATKVLLIEWEEDEHSPEQFRPGQWTVQWKGRNNKNEGITLNSTTPPTTSDSSRTNTLADPHTHRLYFLLPPGAPVPPSVSISFTPTSNTSPTIAVAIPTLPAIFPPSLLTSGTSLGKKGVLHTLWAKSRLAALRAEVDEEEQQGRFEGVGIEMARDELEWIKEHFGVSEKQHGLSDVPASPRQQYTEIKEEDTRGRTDRPASRDVSTAPQMAPPLHSPTNLPSPTSDRLQQKMKGLRVGTSPSSTASSPTPPTSAASATGKSGIPSYAPIGVFTPPQTGSSNTAAKNPLSPEVGDVAVGSRSLFAALKGPHPSSSPASQSTPKPLAPTSNPGTKRPVAVAPPAGFGTESTGLAGIGSLDEVARVSTQAPAKGAVPEEEEDTEDGGLFALPMTPRSPEMDRSPFSFEKKELVR